MIEVPDYATITDLTTGEETPVTAIIVSSSEELRALLAAAAAGPLQQE